MKAFDRLQGVLDSLLSPNGCPWDKEQTLKTMRGSVLEEMYETIDAIDQGNGEHILEELGDLFWGVTFLCRLLEKEYGYSTDDVINAVADKLVRRHPHVFGDVKIADSAEVIKQWDKQKREEKKERVSALDHLPKSLTSLMRAQTVFKRLRNSDYPQQALNSSSSLTDEKVGAALLDIVRSAHASGIDAEVALNHALRKYEAEYLVWEQAQTQAQTPEPK